MAVEIKNLKAKGKAKADLSTNSDKVQVEEVKANEIEANVHQTSPKKPAETSTEVKKLTAQKDIHGKIKTNADNVKAEDWTAQEGDIVLHLKQSSKQPDSKTMGSFLKKCFAVLCILSVLAVVSIVCFYPFASKVENKVPPSNDYVGKVVLPPIAETYCRDWTVANCADKQTAIKKGLEGYLKKYLFEATAKETANLRDQILNSSSQYVKEVKEDKKTGQWTLQIQCYKILSKLAECSGIFKEWKLSFLAPNALQNDPVFLEYQKFMLKHGFQVYLQNGDVVQIRNFLGEKNEILSLIQTFAQNSPDTLVLFSPGSLKIMGYTGRLLTTIPYTQDQDTLAWETLESLMEQTLKWQVKREFMVVVKGKCSPNFIARMNQSKCFTFVNVLFETSEFTSIEVGWNPENVQGQSLGNIVKSYLDGDYQETTMNKISMFSK